MTSPDRQPCVQGPLPHGVVLVGAPDARILTPEALGFVADLERTHRSRRQKLIAQRAIRQAQFDQGELPDFLGETKSVREGDWRITGTPDDLLDRRVEITGPVERKMVINALNSGARVFMADFEDSCSPTWENLIQGQQNLSDAVRRTIDFVAPATGKSYALNDKLATLVVRPRGWHLDEKHLLVDGEPVSASIFDFALYLWHNAHELLRQGTGPYFYLPKLESHLEARLWNDVFLQAQKAIGLPLGTIKSTVLIETLPAAFEMDEILFELREHIVGLNCGRWDYIFSFIKTTRNLKECVMPDRGTVGMDRRFLRSYSALLVETCHRRGAHAMGGMAAQIPIKGDDEANQAAMLKVVNDKRREVAAGHDGTWVAHPGLIPLALAEFDDLMPGANQISTERAPSGVAREDLLAVPQGSITLEGVRMNLSVGLRYTAAWLCGNGCVPLDNLMEDAATAEISRAQLWQWRRHGAQTTCGVTVDAFLLRTELAQTLATLRAAMGDIAYAGARFRLAGELFEAQIQSQTMPAFLTLAAYDHLES